MSDLHFMSFFDIDDTLYVDTTRYSQERGVRFWNYFLGKVVPNDFYIFILKNEQVKHLKDSFKRYNISFKDNIHAKSAAPCVNRNYPAKGPRLNWFIFRFKEKPVLDVSLSHVKRKGKESFYV